MAIFEVTMSLRRLPPLLLFALSSCGAPPPVTLGPDQSIPSLRDLGVSLPDQLFRCQDDRGCSPPTAKCDQKTGRCVACLGDDGCPPGQSCSAEGLCRPDCGKRGCADGGVCDVDAGVCKGCGGDSDCGDPAAPRCEVASGRCFPCLPDRDDCPQGSFCKRGNAGWACVGGCAKDEACKNADGGSPSSACCNNVCADVTSDPGNCGTCGKACAMGMACCNGTCIDLTADPANCGACGKGCDLANAMASCKAGKCAVGKCKDGFEDCNRLDDDGCEADLATDPSNCQGCGNGCVVAHGKATCKGGCAIAGCDPGWADCDQAYGSGCEVETATNLANCGACNMTCGNVAAGTPACAQGKCVIAACNPGFVDCDQQLGNGCEVDTASDVKNCGGCGKPCAAIANGTPACLKGACDVGTCEAPFADCDSDGATGCEANTKTEVKHCGACGKACPAITNGVPGCLDGACGIASCNNPFRDCNNSSADGCETNLANDIKNCGACGRVCPIPPNGAPACANGVCGVANCGNPFQDCNGNPADGCEANTATDVANCGQCNNRCPAVANGQPGCNAGACGIAFCNAPFKDCNNNRADGCEINAGSDVGNCGACGNKCNIANGSPGCANSQCTIAGCNGTFRDCKNGATDGCETDTGIDVANCGACGNNCPNVANGSRGCSASKCVVAACNAPFRDCDGNLANGCEANSSTDVKNCGACGKACAANQTCVGGACAGCLAGGKAPPATCYGARDPGTSAIWTVCTADCSTAWISHNQNGGGVYHPQRICQDLGYTGWNAWDGNCGSICGYCDGNHSCSNRGRQVLNRGANAPNMGSDAIGARIGNTVSWRCYR